MTTKQYYFGYHVGCCPHEVMNVVFFIDPTWKKVINPVPEYEEKELKYYYF